MDVIKKDATITNTDEDFPGSFEVILSAPTKDRDGDVLLPEEWKTPLPERITFDADHGMSVGSTVGSGVPEILADGRLKVVGTYSSLPRAQEVRTLVKEGHIDKTSVAFMTERSTEKGGKAVVKRELLNGAFVAVPSNREAVVLASKSFEEKAGARNSQTDAQHIQAIHDHAIALGADPKKTPPDPKDAAKALLKAADGETSADDPEPAETDPKKLIAQADAAIDSAIAIFSAADLSSLPAEIQQAIAAVQTADGLIDDLMDVVGIPDPDEDAASGATKTPAAGASAPAAGAKAAPVEGIEMQVRAARLRMLKNL